MAKVLMDLLVNVCVVQEGIYLFQKGVDPYSGGLFRQVRFGVQHFITIYQPNCA